MRNAAKNLSIFQPQRMAEQPEVGTKVAEIIVSLTKMASGLILPFRVIVDDPAGNSFIQNPFAPKADPNLKTYYYTRTSVQDMSLGLKPTKTTYKDEDTNYLALVNGAGFGAGAGADSNATSTMDNTETPGDSNGNLDDVSGTLGRKEVVSIPDVCPSCGHPGESLTAITTIPHFKEVSIRLFPIQIFVRQRTRLYRRDSCSCTFIYIILLSHDSPVLSCLSTH